MPLRLAILVLGKLKHVPQATLVALPCIKAFRRLAARACALHRVQFWSDRGNDRLGNLILEVEQVGKLAIVPFGPNVVTGGRVDQLRGNADPITTLTDAMERKRARRKPPESLDAWESYQRGLWNVFQFTEDDNREAQRLFRRAIKLDPSFATAHAGLAYAHALAVNSGFSEDRTESLNQMRLGAQRAVAEDEKEAFGHAVLARYYTYSGENQAAINAARTAIDLNPNFAYAHHVLGLAMISVNKPDEAIRADDAAARLSPHDPMYAFYDATRSIACFLMRDYEQAREFAEKASRRPTVVGFWPYALLASALAHLGRREEAKRALEEARRHESNLSLEFIRRAIWWRHDHLENLFEGLRKAGMEESGEPAADN